MYSKTRFSSSDIVIPFAEVTIPHMFQLEGAEALEPYLGIFYKMPGGIRASERWQVLGVGVGLSRNCKSKCSAAINNK
jgi:hypothetical protein